jgi:hypothetical protein
VSCDLRTLAAEIEALSPPARLRLAADLLEHQRADLAHTIAERVVLGLGAALASGRARRPEPAELDRACGGWKVTTCSSPAACHWRGSDPFVCPDCRRSCCPCIGANDAFPDHCDDCAVIRIRAAELAKLGPFASTLVQSEAERFRDLDESRARARIADSLVPGSADLAAQYGLSALDCANVIAEHGPARAEQLAVCAARFGTSLAAVSSAVRVLGMGGRK